MPDTKKRIAVSVGPIPARLDSVKFITNRFKGGLAAATAKALADKGDDVTVVAWKYTSIPDDVANSDIKEIVRVQDVFEYYNWFVANAKHYDAFVMAAAVANLTPVNPYEGKFPSHLYKPGDEFDIKFMIAPRAIDAVKQINPRACLIGYKLFDTPDDNELIDIARHTLADAKANIIFANRPAEAKTRKIAVTADGSAFDVDFNEHVNLIHRAIHQTYFRTVVEPMNDNEKNDPEIKAAMAIVKHFENTFPKYGTIAIPVYDGCQFVTTSRGHKSDEPVLVREIDIVNGIVRASGKATLNAPAMSCFIDKTHYAIHRHFNDPLAQINETASDDDKDSASAYIFPGTIEEYKTAAACAAYKSVLCETAHGYVKPMAFEPVNWTEYHKTFPEKYFGIPEKFQSAIDDANKDDGCTLEIGGNTHPQADYSYDPYVTPENSTKPITLDQIGTMRFRFGFSKNAICYLTEEELKTILAQCDTFMANAPANMPDMKTSADEVAVRINNKIRHYLMLSKDRIMRHEFFAYDEDFYKKLGLTVTRYKANSALITKNMTV